MNRFSRSGRRWRVGVVAVLAVATATTGALMATTSSSHSSASTAIHNVAAEAPAVPAAPASVRLGDIICTLTPDLHRIIVLVGTVRCTAPVDKIEMVGSGEDRDGDTTWTSAPYTCLNTAYCNTGWSGSHADSIQTLCATVWKAGYVPPVSHGCVQQRV